MPSRHETGWDRIYHKYPPERLPWELGKPRQALVELVDSGRVKPCKTLDLCCGVGTNPVYLALRGFDVTALDVSDGAVKRAKSNAEKAKADLKLLVADFSSLPLGDGRFGFAFDFGCFHHVSEESRKTFARGIHRVLERMGTYMMVCFSYRNGPAWNHFTKEQIMELFGDFFKIEQIRHVSSLEGDGVTRYFYEVLMLKV